MTSNSRTNPNFASQSLFPLICFFLELAESDYELGLSLAALPFTSERSFFRKVHSSDTYETEELKVPLVFDTTKAPESSGHPDVRDTDCA